MSDKTLAVLGIIAVLAAGAAILQNQLARHTHTSDFSSSALIEGLNIDAVVAIRITGGQADGSVNLVRTGGRFAVSEMDNYPAAVSKVNNLINQCLDLRTAEKITSNPHNHADLQVTEETARCRVAFLDKENNPIVTAVLSETDPDTGAAYARLLSEDDVYRIQNAPWINTRPIDYVDTELISVSRDNISSIAVKTPDSNYVLSSPAGSDDIRLEKMPAGKQLKGTTYQTVFGALSSLRFEDVSPTSNIPQDLDFDKTYSCRLYDLTVYKLAFAESDDKTYVKVTADYLDKTPVEKTVGDVETDEELKKKETKLLAIDVVKDFNAQHEDWVYQIPSYKAGQLIKPLSELLEDIPEPEQADQPADANDTEIMDAASEE